MVHTYIRTIQISHPSATQLWELVRMQAMSLPTKLITHDLLLRSMTASFRKTTVSYHEQ